MFLIINDNRLRLCQDKKWRGFANFGTFKECVREYKTLGKAKRKAIELKARVLHLKDGWSMDASGETYDPEMNRITPPCVFDGRLFAALGIGTPFPQPMYGPTPAEINLMPAPFLYQGNGTFKS